MKDYKDIDFSVIKRIYSLVINRYKWLFIVSIITMIIGCINGLVLFLIKYILDYIIVPLIGNQNPNFLIFYEALFGIGIIVIISLVSKIFYYKLNVKIALGVMYVLRKDLFEHMQKLPIDYFDNRKTGDLMSIFTNDTNILESALLNSLPELITTVVELGFNITFMIIISPTLTAIALIMLIIFLYITKIIAKNSGKYFSQRQSCTGEIVGYSEEIVNAQSVVKICNQEESVKKRFDELNNNLYTSTLKANIYSNVIKPIIDNLGIIQFIITTILGLILLLNGRFGLTIGGLITYAQISKNFSVPFIQIAEKFNTIVMAISAGSRIYELLDASVEEDNWKVELVRVKDTDNGYVETDEQDGINVWKIHGDKKNEYVKVEGKINISNVNFGYNEKLVLNNINIEASKGKKIAIVGATGSGKTTIINLINRFYELTDGKILYDGIDIKDIKKSDLRKTIGVVLQDTHLFTDTIFENIRYGRLEADEEDVKNAAKIAMADDIIEKLDNKYDTKLYMGANQFSEGEKQLISIARATISKSNVLILDEATAKIDTRTEKFIQLGLDNIMKDKTVFIIAHRLSTIKDCDNIIVLDNGCIKENGNHSELISKKGIYYKLYTGVSELL